MKVAIVYNGKNSKIVNVFGIQNKEWYPPETISKVARALEKAGHTVKLIEGDRNLISKLEDFLPRLSKDREPGIVFNLALGIQGKCRYTHVPAVLEMAGIPYTGSSPLGHALALDKVIAKQIFIASGIPTPNFTVFYNRDRINHHLRYPLVVKPKMEAASMGVRVVTDEKSLKDAVTFILEKFKQPALAEEFIEGREINVSIFGNNPPRILPVLELQMGEAGPNIFTYDLKFDHTGKKVTKICPAVLSPSLANSIQESALKAYRALNIYDHARVDMRLDKNNSIYILELNSMVSINPTSSFVYAARVVGLDYDQLINKILESALERYALEEPDFFGCYKRKEDEHVRF